MIAAPQETGRIEPFGREAVAETRHEKWASCHVNWTGVWVGALAAFCMVVLFGLIGTALGAHLLGAEHRIIDVKKIGIWALIFSVCGAFFSFVIGGWIAAKIAGILHSEPAIIHGAIVWLVTILLLVAIACLGGASLFGSWYGGLNPAGALSPNAPFVRPDPPGPNPTSEEIASFKTQQAEYNRDIQKWREDTPQVTRNTRLGSGNGTVSWTAGQCDRFMDGFGGANELHALPVSETSLPYAVNVQCVVLDP